MQTSLQKETKIYVITANENENQNRLSSTYYRALFCTIVMHDLVNCSRNEHGAKMKHVNMKNIKLQCQQTTTKQLLLQQKNLNGLKLNDRCKKCE